MLSSQAEIALDKIAILVVIVEIVLLALLLGGW